MSTTLHRAPVTAALLSLLALTNKPVGDAIMPANAGWSGNQPNKDGSNFTPYVVLTPGSATASSGSMAMPQADWRMPYSLSSFGVSRQQCEWMADRARYTADGLKGQTLDLTTGTFRVQMVAVDAIGGLVRVDATEPPYWGQIDQITIWLSKEIA